MPRRTKAQIEADRLAAEREAQEAQFFPETQEETVQEEEAGTEVAVVSQQEDTQQVAPIPPINPFDMRVSQYVRLRDLIKEKDDAHKEQMAPYREALNDLNSLLLNQLNNAGADSVGTSAGTVYRTKKESASIADMEAFWGYIEKNDAFDLLDKRANVTAIRDFIEEFKVPPPGINFTTTHVVGVRRK